MSTARANARGEVSPSGPPLAHPAAPSTLTFSFIVPVCHGGAKFDECLKGVAAAMGPRDELVVVADGEGDGSWRLAEQSEAEVIRVAKRRGPAHARNIGARQANGDILFFVDADVVIPADARDKVREVLEQEPDVAAIIGSYDDDPSERNFLSQFKNLFHHFVHQHASTE